MADNNANFTNTYSPTPHVTAGQGSSVSNREDLLDVLTILAPEETPVLSSSPKKKANSTFVEWTIDSIDAVNTDGIGARIVRTSDVLTILAP